MLASVSRFARLVLLVMPWAVTACTPDSATTQRGGTVTVIELADMDKPMPFLSETTLDGAIVGVTFMPLLAPRWENGELIYLTANEDVTALARSYEYFGPDSASLRYHLRGDVVWSDGTPVTAHDAVWSIETRGDPRTASPRIDYNRQIVSVEAEDDSTLVIHFTRRYPEMLFHTAGPPAPRHIFEGTDPAQLRSHPALTDPVNNMVFNGPYRIGEWIRGQRVVLVPNPYFQPQPNIQRVVFRTIPEETTRMVELQTGNADVMAIPFDKLELVRSTSPNIRFETRRRRFYDYIAYNPLAHPAFADRDIRRALGLAIDVEGLIDALQLSDYAEPAGGPYAPILRNLHDPELHAPLPYDPDEARRILDQKGWLPGPDGIRVRNGQRLTFTLATNSGNQRRADIAQIVQPQWRNIGVDARIQMIETNTFFDRLNQRDFEAAIAGWSVGLSADISDLWMGDVPFNFTSYSNPAVNRLFELAMAQPTEDQAAPFWREAAHLIVQDQPYTWLFYMDEVVGVHNRIQNTRIDALGTFQNLHEWTIRGGGSE
ncbi:MAG TPA: ABC transporter substrate-binding protein [Longimicrobiales bacterium]|nr:ABC transporter substrate-binding protein [Longimicrobiales bacterium]